MSYQSQNPHSQATSHAHVLSAMSGGVDSSVATMLLAEQGYEVTGITMRLFDSPDRRPSREAEDAKSVCDRMGIPHAVLDFRDKFAACVIDPFCTSYLNAETPNPCIKCNRHLKLAGLQEHRRQLGAQYVATGHYVRRAFDPETSTWQLLRAIDHNKDQSYVLYHLTQEDLAHMLFPLGSLKKEQVRQLAAEHGFANAQKPESQDICFIPDGDYAGFIEQRATAAGNAFAAGEIVDDTGKVRGRHNGLIHYTIGQRKGLGIANPVPLYVKEKDPLRNRLIVAPHEGLMTNCVKLRDVNVISGDYHPRTVEVTVKLSYRQQPVAASIQLLDHREALVQLETPQVRPAPGQAVVAYVGEVVLAGGTVTL